MTPTTETDPATVAVPVELLKAWSDDLIHIGGFATGQIGRQIADVIPKPKPRLVAVDWSRIHDAWEDSVVDQGKSYDALLAELAEQPDLLTLLEDVMVRVQMNSSQRSAVLIALKHDLGVTE